jgi:hypothetical protein
MFYAPLAQGLWLFVLPIGLGCMGRSREEALGESLERDIRSSGRSDLHVTTSHAQHHHSPTRKHTRKHTYDTSTYDTSTLLTINADQFSFAAPRSPSLDPQAAAPAHLRMTERNKSNAPEKARVHPVLSLAAGLVTGNVIAVVFNPIDRALYLSMREHRPFFRLENFRNPWRGLSQAVVHRTLSHGMYYILQQELRQRVAPWVNDGRLSERQAAFVVGTCAGTINGLVLNPIAAVKYQLWSTEEGSVWRALRHKWVAGGVRPFLKGSSASMLRDVLFGCVYELLRHRPPPQHSTQAAAGANTSAQSNPGQPTLKAMTHYIWRFSSSFFAAGCAVALSSPFNYARQRIYACPPHLTPPTIPSILHNLLTQAASVPTLLGRLRFLQIQLAIGLGTARSAAGMASGQLLFDYAVTFLSSVNTAFSLGFD